MFKNYLITLGRQLWRNRLFTILNIIGLSVCISVAWIVFRMVSYEYSFDKKIPGVENIYQVISKNKDASGASEGGFAGVSKPVLNTLKNEVTGIDMVVPMFYKYERRAAVKDGSDAPVRKFEKEDDIQLVSTSPDYFKLLGYNWLAGNPATALDAPDKLVLTDSKAHEYFPSLKPQDVVGKTITYNDTISRRVSGVVAQLNYPNSFSNNNEFIAVSKKDLADNNWGGMSSNDLIFIKPGKNASPGTILKQLNAINFRHNKEAFEKYKYKSWYDVIPMSQKHFEGRFSAQTRTANKNVLNGLIIVGAFLLLLACINYINLSTAQLPQRAKEIGIRKTLGSSSRALIRRFMTETFVVASFAALLSFALTSFALKIFAGFLPDGLFNYMNYTGMAAFLLTLIVVISTFSGLYPAWLSTKVNTVNVLKGATGKIAGSNRLSLRKGLIVFQFLIAQVFIIGSVIIGQQIKYALHKDLGFNKNGIITVTVPYYINDDPNYRDKQFALKNELQKSSLLKSISLGNRPMDNSLMRNMLNYYKDTAEIQQLIDMKFGDADYLNLYGFNLLAGRNFVAADTMNELVINEKAVKAYGFKSPLDAIGKVLTSPSDKSRTYPIVGVVADFHQFGVQSEITPALITTSKGQSTTLNIRLPEDASQWKAAISMVERQWGKLYAGVPFNYTFYDDTIKELYKTEEQTQQLVTAATVIAILISCLGLFGLATLTAFQRTKEVGIRKVLGASVPGIVKLLSKEFLLLVVISVIIATPIAWWMMQKWLQDFAYRVEIQWWMFVIAALVAAVIAFLTVSYQAVKAATVNPAKSLRTE